MTDTPTSTPQNEPEQRSAVKYAIDALLIAVPLLGTTFFLFEPEAFNAFTAWLTHIL
jgi:hypothetical protein